MLPDNLRLGLPTVETLGTVNPKIPNPRAQIPNPWGPNPELYYRTAWTGVEPCRPRTKLDTLLEDSLGFWGRLGVWVYDVKHVGFRV